MTEPPIPPTYTHLADSRRLWRAWRRVWRSNGAFGGDGQTIGQFGENVGDELGRLRQELLDRRYRPHSLRVCRIPKRDGTERRLHIPSVRDRVVQQAALSMLGPWLEPHFEAGSWAYRPGRSHILALAALRRSWMVGYRWVAEGDIESFFDRIDRAQLATVVDRYVPDPELTDLVMTWMGGRTGRGIPQGAPLSPLLSNLYLDRFDEEVGLGGRRLVRFGDDFVVATKSSIEAADALAAARRVLSSLALRLQATKTAVRSPGDAVIFLGSELHEGRLRARWAPPVPPKRRNPHRRADGWEIWFDRSQRQRFRLGTEPDPSSHVPEPEVSARELGPAPTGPTVPVSALRDLLTCPHAAHRVLCLDEDPVTAKMLEGIELHREMAHLEPGPREVAVYSRALGLVGRVDAVESRDGSAVVVELKSGLARVPSYADKVQVAAYVLALSGAEEPVAGELAFTQSGRREPVAMTPYLLTRTTLHVRQLHDIADGHWVPNNRRRPACSWCRHRPACQGED